MSSSRPTKPGNGSAHWMRVHARLKCKGVARFRLLPNGCWMEGQLADLSICGCCIATTQSVACTPGSCVEVHLKVKGNKVLMSGVIRHVYQSRMGIEFLEVSARKREQIQDMVMDIMRMDPLDPQSRLLGTDLHNAPKKQA